MQSRNRGFWMLNLHALGSAGAQPVQVYPPPSLGVHLTQQNLPAAVTAGNPEPSLTGVEISPRIVTFSDGPPYTTIKATATQSARNKHLPKKGILFIT